MRQKLINTGEFYDLLCSYSFRPLILKTARVTLKSAILIDNIFINDISSHSGDVTSSISDHYFQFAQTDVFETFWPIKKSRICREFEEELINCDWSDIVSDNCDWSDIVIGNCDWSDIVSGNCDWSDIVIGNCDWSDIVSGNYGTDYSYTLFYKKIEDILDLLAPYRKMAQKEIKLEQMPWITLGILVSMSIRDDLRKRRNNENDPDIKSQFDVIYKRYHNINLLKRSKQNYYSSYFTLNQSNVKKTWDGIRNLINVSKKKIFSPTTLIYKNEGKWSNIDMAESLNDFFVNIGTSIEAKIPKAKESFLTYLKDSNAKSIFLSPCTPIEIIFIMKDMKSSKVCGPNSISTNLLIEFSELLASPLSCILNVSIHKKKRNV